MVEPIFRFVSSKEGKKRLAAGKEKVKGWIKSGSDALKKYEMEAPKRRATQIKKLQDEIKISKLKSQKRKLEGEYTASMTSGYGLTGMGIGSDWGAPTSKKSAVKRKAKRKTTRKRKKKR